MCPGTALNAPASLKHPAHPLPGTGVVWTLKLFFFAELCVWLCDLCGFLSSFTSYRKVRKGFRKERKANCITTRCLGFVDTSTGGEYVPLALNLR